MDIKNIGIKSNDNNDFPQTSVDNALNKDNLFALDTDIIAIKKCLQDIYYALSPFTTWVEGTDDDTHLAGLHNSVYRGKRLGAQVTQAQLDSIANGSFYDLWIGDYWQINSNKWRIAAFDYFYGMGTPRHHIVIVPDSILVSGAKINSTATAAGGYAGSDFRTGNNGNTARQNAINAISNAFGAANILTHQEWFSKSVDSAGVENDIAQYDATVELLNEHMLYGGKIFEQTTYGTNRPAVQTIANSQLPLFFYAHEFIKSNGNCWLRTITTAPYFSAISPDGLTTSFNAGQALAIRPYFCLYKG